MNTAKVAAKTRKHHSCTPSFANTVENSTAPIKATMHIDHKPGEKMEVDWVGQTASLIDTDTGEIIPAYIFIMSFLQWLRLCGSVSVTNLGMLDYGSCSRLSLLWRCYARSGSRTSKTGVANVPYTPVIKQDLP